MKRVIIGSALAAVFALALGCGQVTDQETYKPAPGVTPDCTKYTVQANELKCLRDQSRH